MSDEIRNQIRKLPHALLQEVCEDLLRRIERLEGSADGSKVMESVLTEPQPGQDSLTPVGGAACAATRRGRKG